MAKKDTDQYDKELLEMAIATRNWAKRTGCFIEPDEGDEKKHGYFTIDEWADYFEYPKKQWRDVKKKLLAMGEPLTMDDFGGHYWGKPGSQAKNPMMLIVRAMTMMETAAYQMTAVVSTKDRDACIKVIEEHLSNSRHQMTPETLIKALNGAGLALPSDIRAALLPAGN